MPLALVAAQRLKVAATILFHSTCAISVTLVSKSALNGVNAPVTLLALQTCVQVLLLTVVGKALGWIRLSNSSSSWKAFIPLALARTVGVLAKTFCLAAVDASFYQIARGLLLPFTLILSYLFLNKSLSAFPPLAIVGCGSVISGFGIGMISDFSKMLTSGKGLAWGVGSSLTTAVEAVVVKKFVSAEAKQKGDNMIQMVWMSNVISVGLYIPVLILSGEYKELSNLSLDNGFAKTCIIAGCCSFWLTLATFLQISVTSPTTHMVVTAARGVAQSAFAVLLLPKETMNNGRIWSMVCILGGSALYGWAEDQAMAKEKAGYKVAARMEEGDQKEGEGGEQIVLDEKNAFQEKQ